MEPLFDSLAEGIARRLNRRDLFSKGLRGLVRLGMGSAMLFGAQRFAYATPNCTTLLFETGAGTSCDVPGDAYCDGNEANWGCGGLPNCTGSLAQYCNSPTNSNCINGWESKGYWDCCCDGNQHRCRDCGPVGGDPQCVCHAQIPGTCS